NGIYFGDNLAPQFTILSATEIRVTAPPGDVGSVRVLVSNPYGISAATPADLFTYFPPPAVTGIDPAEGPTTGNTPVTITGTGFYPPVAVTFDGVAANSVSYLSPTQIVATTPHHWPGLVGVTVTTPYGTSSGSEAAEFSYEGTPPNITWVTPSHGPM